MNADPNCLFCKIVAGQIPAKKAYEDLSLIHISEPTRPY